MDMYDGSRMLTNDEYKALNESFLSEYTIEKDPKFNHIQW